MDQSPIDVVFFDLGNVILPFNHYPIGEKLSSHSWNNTHWTPMRIFSYLFDLESGAVNGYETGKVSTTEFFDSLRKTFQVDISFDEFAPIWNDIFTEDGRVSRIISSLKGKKRLGLLSNTNPLHFEYIVSKFPIVRILDRWILSHEVGFKKPAVEIFQKAMDWAAVEPKKILYIDDMERYVDVARSLGMQGVHFVSGQALEEELICLL